MEELRPEDPAAIGPYRLSARLGAGGMGRVYLGRSAAGRRVAVKVVRPEYAADPGFRQRFRREVEAARAVGGFWTAPVVDADPEAEAPWVASAYIEAPDLGRLVETRGPLGEPELRHLAAGLAEALEAVHRAGLVHRDLKPSNVLVTSDGPRVIDFGISKALEGATQLTGSGTVVGTPAFMSPEQATGEAVGAPSDVFALGSVLVFAATGEGPFGTGSAPALLYRVVHDAPRLDGVPEGLRGVLGACLAKDPAARPTPAELLGLLGVGADMDLDAGVDGGEPREPLRSSEGRGAARTAVATALASPTPAPPEPSPAARTEVPPQPAPRGGDRQRVEIRARLARRPGDRISGWGYQAFGLVAAMSGLAGVSSWHSDVLPYLVIACGLGLIAYGYLEGETGPLPETALWVNGWGLGFAFRKASWNTPWGDVAEVAMELRPGKDDQVVCVVLVVPQPGRPLPKVFRERGHAGTAVTAVPFQNRDAARPQVTRLDAALHRHAAGKYRRDPSLAALVDF
ncbi:serine/threonine-protein kinase [Streptomyces tritici]|uniref:serine/threonine-protein kinase n=1 Tax=Streptomyces tritici TaxID=2054410 RepID=UPI003AEFBF0B